MKINDQPVYLNLLKIKLPLTGIVSFLHRISGVFLVFTIPLAIYLLQLSLQNQDGFHQAANLLNHPLMVALQIIIVASLLYHLFAGIRFLMMDVDIGYEKKIAELSSWLVLITTLMSVLFFIYFRFF